MSTATDTPPPAPAAPEGAPAAAPPPAPASGAPASGGSAAGGNAPTFHSASLYVGDLAPSVNEGLLFEIFNAVGPVASIRVCRDAVTRRSLGYSYVNFHQVQDAERALDTMNYTLIKGKACRIMWSQRDPSLRKSGVGNVFVKNLDLEIDNKQLYDTFSLFGNILSCKVVTDPETGKSKGYGYVHYETQDAAQAAISKLDGMTIEGIVIEVKMFTKKQERPDQLAWQNCFVKNIPLHWSDALLESTFAEFGPVLSAHIKMGQRTFKPKAKKEKEDKKDDANEDSEDKEEKKDGDVTQGEGEEENKEENEEEDDVAAELEKLAVKDDEDKDKDEGEEGEDAAPKPDESLGFGFVSFENHEEAVKAVEALNDKEFDEFEEKPEGEEEMPKLKLFVSKAQKKNDRERELKMKYDDLKRERINKFQGVNLYVKNLDDSVTDDKLREEFSVMGTITSARVMKDTNGGNPAAPGAVSRGFGFVCYSSPEEATEAVQKMNGKIINGKPIFVALAQRKEVRRAQLEAQHNNGARGAGMQHGHMGMQQGHMGVRPNAGMNPMVAGPYMGMPQMYLGQGGRGAQQGMAPYPLMPMMSGGRGRGAYQGGRGMQNLPQPYAQPYGQRLGQPVLGGRGGRGMQGRGMQGRGAAMGQMPRVS